MFHLREKAPHLLIPYLEWAVKYYEAKIKKDRNGRRTVAAPGMVVEKSADEIDEVLLHIDLFR
jgi:hypothetical protein